MLWQALAQRLLHAGNWQDKLVENLHSESRLHHPPDGAAIRVGSLFFREDRCAAKRIIIADNSPHLREALRRVLGANGDWQSHDAVDGHDAVQKAGRGSFDLVTLDLSRPVMNGPQAARELRRLFPTLPLLLYTNFKTAHLEQEAFEAGVSLVFSKSEPIENLFRTIHSLLDPAA